MSGLSRRASLLATVSKTKSHEARGKVGSGSSGRGPGAMSEGIRLALDLADLPRPPKGDVYYRTVRIYPSIPVGSQEYFILISRNLEQSLSSAGRKDRRNTVRSDESRIKTSPIRVDTLTPPTDEVNR